MNNHPLWLIGLGTWSLLGATQGSGQCSGAIQATGKTGVSLSKTRRGGMEEMGFPGKIFQRCHFGSDTPSSAAHTDLWL